MRAAAWGGCALEFSKRRAKQSFWPNALILIVNRPSWIPRPSVSGSPLKEPRQLHLEVVDLAYTAPALDAPRRRAVDMWKTPPYPSRPGLLHLEFEATNRLIRLARNVGFGTGFEVMHRVLVTKILDWRNAGGRRLRVVMKVWLHLEKMKTGCANGAGSRGRLPHTRSVLGAGVGIFEALR